jgi:hypothetical protein
VLFDICKLLHTYLQVAGRTDLFDIGVEAALRQDDKDRVRQIGSLTDETGDSLSQWSASSLFSFKQEKCVETGLKIGCRPLLYQCSEFTE